MVDTSALTKDRGEKEWDENIFECFNNPVMCLYAVCVPCGTVCMQALDADFMFKNENPNEKIIACLLSCLLCCCGAAHNRQKLREKFNIRGNYITDLLLWWCCGAMAPALSVKQSCSPQTAPVGSVLRAPSPRWTRRWGPFEGRWIVGGCVTTPWSGLARTTDPKDARDADKAALGKVFGFPERRKGSWRYHDWNRRVRRLLHRWKLHPVRPPDVASDRARRRERCAA